jgi:hypothetical protein
MAESWPWWAALIGLGAFHGLNPAMGWLFAVGLGLQGGGRRVVAASLLPLALGHALSIAAVVAAAMGLGVVVAGGYLRPAAAALLIGFGLWLLLGRRRHRFRVGMLAGFGGLTLWSFLMATAHGAGLMLLPVVLPTAHAHHHGATGGLAAVLVHSGAMIAVTGAVAVAVHDWIGLGILRRGWVNLDLVWTIALIAAGVLLLAVPA